MKMLNVDFVHRVLDTVSLASEGISLSEVRADIGCTIDAATEAVNALAVEKKVRVSSNSSGIVTVFPVAERPTKKPMSGIVKLDYRIRYDIIGTGDVNDALAKALRAYIYVDGRVSIERLSIICVANEIDEARFRGLNPGHIRMCVGNMLRARVRRKEKVFIGETTL